MTSFIKYYQVAGITICLESDLPITPKTFHPKFKLFEVDGPGQDNVIIHHHDQFPEKLCHPSLPGKEIHRKDQWQIIKDERAWIYKYTPILPSDIGYPTTGIFSLDHSKVDIYCSELDKTKYANACFQALTLFNSDQILFSKLLSDRKGVILHSNGFDINGKGILLAGNSGAGKSTLSKILTKRGNKILCDDRMFVTQNNESLYIHGNWCHGTVPNTSPGKLPLHSIFFLEQSKKNNIEPITDKSITLQKIIQALVKPVLIKNDWRNTLSTINDIVSMTSCYTLQFDLSGNICKIIEDTVKIN